MDEQPANWTAFRLLRSKLPNTARKALCTNPKAELKSRNRAPKVADINLAKVDLVKTNGMGWAFRVEGEHGPEILFPKNDLDRLAHHDILRYRTAEKDEMAFNFTRFCRENVG